jgi:penicillin-binding protein 1A
MVRIDRRSGKKVFGEWPSGNDPKAAVIWEAFKPESEPRRAIRHTDMAGGDLKQALDAARARIRESRAAEAQRSAADSEFLQSEGGIY